MKMNRLRISVLWSFVLLSACGGNSNSNSPSTQSSSIQMGGAIQGKTLALSQAVTTFAGSSSGSDGAGTAARFIAPGGITTDGTNLYVTDKDNTIRKIVIATGQVTTVAGTPGVYGSTDGVGTAASFYSPAGIVTDGLSLYVADSQNGTVRKIEIATGVVTTIAGNPRLHGGSFDGTGTAATFSLPIDLATDGINLYVRERGNTLAIRKIVIATGVVTTLSSNSTMFGSGITTDGTTLYIADAPAIRKLNIATGIITTQSTNPYVVNPSGMTTDGTDIYFVDSFEYKIRKMALATGLVTTLAGQTGVSGTADGTGIIANFLKPSGITSDGASLYIIDDRAIRKLVIATGEVTTLAGNMSAADDGVGKDARFHYPKGVTTDGLSLYTTDFGAIHQIVVNSGEVRTLAGSSGVFGTTDGIGVAARFGGSNNITTDGTNLYVTDNDTIRKVVIASGTVTTLVRIANPLSSGVTGTTAQPPGLFGITTDGENLFVTDIGGNTIRKVVIASGEATTIAGSIGVRGSTDGIGSAALFSSPKGITTDGKYLYVADNSNIRKIEVATGDVKTLAGRAGVYGSSDGTASAALFRMPRGVTTDGTYLYVTDSTTIRKIEISSGEVTTIAGNSAYGSIDAVGTMARFFGPADITTDGKSIFVVDAGSSVIRKVD